MLTALMDEDTHAKFQALRRDIKEACGDRVAQVFVPVGADAPPQPSGAPRLLFIGKATRDFSQPELATFEGARASAVGHLSALPQGVSAFWQFARAIAREVLQQTEGDASDAALTAHCGWSNLAKIGDIYDNPGPASLAIQAPLSVNLSPAYETGETAPTCGQSSRAETARARSSASLIVGSGERKGEAGGKGAGREGRRRRMMPVGQPALPHGGEGCGRRAARPGAVFGPDGQNTGTAA